MEHLNRVKPKIKYSKSADTGSRIEAEVERDISAQYLNSFLLY